MNSRFVKALSKGLSQKFFAMICSASHPEFPLFFKKGLEASDAGLEWVKS
jgi:hypothetical protein